jgi:hypothetical protein
MNAHNGAGPPIGRIRVSRDGTVFYEGRPTTLEGLRTSLAELRAQQGVVWYYREAAATEPPPQAMAVIQLVIAHRLPISMSTMPDFSDVVGPDGHAVPRDTPPTLS